MQVVSPFKNKKLEDCFECEQITVQHHGGGFPMGTHNRIWHGGIHLQTSEEVVAVAPGRIIAYRFNRKPSSSKVNGLKYSNSFMLLEHEYQTTSGVKLPFYSLYYHLDEQEAQQNPMVLEFSCEVAVEKDPHMKILRLIQENGLDTQAALPMGTKVTVVETLKSKGKKRYKVKYQMSEDAEEVEGYIHQTTCLTQLEGDQYVVSQTPDTSYYYSSKEKKNLLRDHVDLWKGLPLYTDIGLEVYDAMAPKGTKLVLKKLKQSGWYQVLSHPLNLDPQQTYYIHPDSKGWGVNSQNIQAIPAELDQVVVLEPEKRPYVCAGDVLGKPGQIYGCGKQGIHLEIFTSEDLKKTESILFDPGRDATWAKEKIFVPAGTTYEVCGEPGYALEKGDLLVESEKSEDGLYTAVFMRKMVRKALRSKFGDYSSKHYENSQNADVSLLFCNLDDKQPFRFIRKESGNQRVVALEKPLQQALWIRTDLLVSEETQETWEGKKILTLIQPVQEIFKEKPKAAQKSQVLDRDLFLEKSAKKANYAYVQIDGQGVKIQKSATQITTCFEWPGFYFLEEDGSLEDPFVDIDNIISSEIVQGALQQTSRFQDAIQEFRNQEGKLDPTALTRAIAKVNSWGLFHKAIVRTPSEWNWEGNRWSRLEEILQGQRPEFTSEQITEEAEKHRADAQEMAWWSELKLQDSAQVYTFHPLAFLSQLQEMEESTEGAQEHLNELLLIASGVKTILNGQSASLKAKQGLALCLLNRPGNQEFVLDNQAAVINGLGDNTLKITPEERLQWIQDLASVIHTRSVPDFDGNYLFFEEASKQGQGSLDYEQLEKAKTVDGWCFYRYRKDSVCYASMPTIKGISVQNSPEPDLITLNNQRLRYQKEKYYYLDCKEGSSASVKIKVHLNRPAAMLVQQGDLGLSIVQRWKLSDKIQEISQSTETTEFQLEPLPDTLGYRMEVVLQLGDSLSQRFFVSLKRDPLYLLVASPKTKTQVLTHRDELGKIVPWYQDGEVPKEKMDITGWNWYQYGNGKYWLEAKDLQKPDDGDFDFTITNLKTHKTVLTHEIEGASTDQAIKQKGWVLGDLLDLDGFFNYMLGEKNYQALRDDLLKQKSRVLLMMVDSEDSLEPDQTGLSVQADEEGNTFAVHGGSRVPFFCQADAAWGDESLGVKGTLIRSKGCALSCISMLHKYYGDATINPKILDAYLDKHSGYDGNNMRWNVAYNEYPKSNLTFQETKFNGNKKPAELKKYVLSELNSGRPVVIRVKYADSSKDWNHFVLAVGYTKNKELILNDPGTSGGNGTEKPNNNILEKTQRHQGYTLAYADKYTYQDPDELEEET